jgi:hypothetical protein
MNRTLLVATRRLLAATAIALAVAACGGGNTPSSSHSRTGATSSTGSHKPASKAPGY